MLSVNDANVVEVLLALGSNLGDRAATIRAALADLHASDGIKVMRVSSFIETDAVDMPDAPAFVNAAAVVRTTLSPAALLARCLAIETIHGRRRDHGAEQSLGRPSRTLDIDLILYGSRVIDEPGLRVPHPRMHQRAFVLVPAIQIAADWVDPVRRCPLQDLVDRLNSAISLAAR